MNTAREVDIEAVGHVALITIRRPPFNFLDLSLIQQISLAVEQVDSDSNFRAIVFAADGKAFCAGASLGASSPSAATVTSSMARELYNRALTIFRNKKPIVAAIHGAAIGGGLGLALSADFRVTCPEARFAANFTQLGFHPGFGLTVTLAEAVGSTNAALMMYTSRRFTGDDAYNMGLASVLVAQRDVKNAALKLATEIAECAPLAVMSTRQSLRLKLCDRIEKALEREVSEQSRLRETRDFEEGVQAAAERRLPVFRGS